MIDISDRDPKDNPLGIPYTLFAESCLPGTPQPQVLMARPADQHPDLLLGHRHPKSHLSPLRFQPFSSSPVGRGWEGWMEGYKESPVRLRVTELHPHSQLPHSGWVSQ